MLDGVLKDIKPSDAKLLKSVDVALKKLNDLISKKKVKAVAVLGGSIAKDTFLKGDHDCDVFVKFDYKTYKDQDISKELGKVLKSLKPELVHGSRDYYFIKNIIQYEIVPVLDIKDPAKAVNVTDMSPLHVDWVKKHPGFEDEIRLAKQFCKAARVYGAESYIKGFSGHVLDILVIYYGGFEKFLQNAVNWKDKIVVDPEKHYNKDALVKLNKSKIVSPLIVVDPVYKERNAAAAMNEKMLDKFKETAREFLKKPTKDFFKIKKFTKAELKRQAGSDKLVVLEVKPLDGKKDIVGAKLLKAMELIRNQIKFYDFDLKEADWVWENGKAYFWYVVEKKDLFPITKWPGPPTSEPERVKSFKEKHEKTFMDKGRICAYVKRRYTKVEELLKESLTDELLKQKVKSIKKIIV